MGYTLALCGRFYHKIVRPLLDIHFPDLPHAAALLGPGSEILGFDDEMSRDHHWGPRVMLFLEPGDLARHADAIHGVLANELPYVFEGFPTNFSAPDPEDRGVQLLEPIDHGPVNHRVTTHTVRGFILDHLGIDVDEEMAAADWLALPEQLLLGVTEGAVYHDEVGLGPTRERFAYYPNDVWLYRLAAGWARIGQEEHLLGRAGYAGDAIGATLIASRLVRDVMRLAFLMERRYAPYPKWFGRAFARLDAAPLLTPLLEATLRAEGWQEQERHLIAAFEALARMHNQLGLTDPVDERAHQFFGRPFRVIGGERIATALLAEITDDPLRRIAALPPIGAVDQFADSTDLLSHSAWLVRVRGMYG